MDIVDFRNKFYEALDREEKNNEKPQKVDLEFHGGELFCGNDGKIVDFFSEINSIIEEVKKQRSILFRVNMVTNLLYKNLDNLIDSANIFINYNNQDDCIISTSFDFFGRFHSKEMLQLGRNNVEKLININKIAPISIQTIVDKNMLSAFKGENFVEMLEIFNSYADNEKCKIILNKLIAKTREEETEMIRECLPYILEEYPYLVSTLFSPPLETDIFLNDLSGTGITKEDFLFEYDENDVHKYKTSIKDRIKLICERA